MSVFRSFERRERELLPRVTSWPTFHYGDRVLKMTGDYTGPGVVRGLAVLDNGQFRYLVAHTLAGGDGELLHVYSEKNLRAVV